MIRDKYKELLGDLINHLTNSELSYYREVLQDKQRADITRTMIRQLKRAEKDLNNIFYDAGQYETLAGKDLSPRLYQILGEIEPLIDQLEEELENTEFWLKENTD